jgi:PAS domain S-box-containing protein
MSTNEPATVLLVEDEPSLRWTMAEFLKRAGHFVQTAENVDEALEILHRAKIDVAVVDIFLPGKSGIDLLKQIHASESYIPVIVTTGEPNFSQIPELIRAGAYDFLHKPVTKDVLIKAVSRGVEKKRLKDEKYRLEQEIQSHAEQLEVRIADRTAELAEAHSFLNAVLDSSTEYAIIAIDTEGLITLFNLGAETMFGYRAEQVLGQHAERLMAGYDEGEGREPLLECGLQAQVLGRHQLEIELGRADGSTFVASLVMTPLVSKSDNRLLGYLGIIKDLTIERQSEKTLREMQARLAHNEKIAALGKVAAHVAHEVKNPLAGLHLYAMHLKNKVAEKLTESEVTLIDKIIDTINNLSNTAEQILDFARPIRIVPRPADLNRVMTDTLHLLEPQIAANKVSVEQELAQPGATGMLDAASIRAALLNLLLNAIQAMPDGGKLIVSTASSDDGMLTLKITDTGSGMTEEQARNVFEPFYTTKSQGLGLGMPYARKIIEQHHGEIKIESIQHQGTSIEVKLPSEYHDAATEATASQDVGVSRN